ncbi:MAG: MFS transporter [Rhodoferax sp.]|uniref:MFS transporter n=1 Tax=Rhodoferax sp. TaxID=50421 RepID=UPI0026072BF3|nr:MFS transporter [Rhodoferax sp.]MDD5334946.1 MFS transporter [Rhodoferax sp.]
MKQQLQLWLRLVPAYAAGYFLSYGLRSVNAVIAPELMRELGVTASGLGLLTSAYFLGFGLFQLPLGLLLDRFGPRRVEASLLLLAAAGCALFGSGKTLLTLALARALIGLGVSACLMASFKTFSQWFPVTRLPSLTATIMVAGGLGALSASVPVEAALPLLGWRGTFFLFAGLLVLAAGFLMTVPDQAAEDQREPLAKQIRTLAGIFGNRIFWRFAPQGCLISGGFMAIQGLWAVPWLMEVNGATRSAAAGVLFLMGLAMLTGFVFVATCSGWLARHKIAPMLLLTAGMSLGLLVELAIILDLARPTWLWPLLGLSFSLSNIAYSQLTAAFPITISGRVNTALNLMVFIGAFGLQWGIGAAVDAFTVGGMERAQAFRLTFALLLAVQGFAFAWFLLPVKPIKPSF